MDSSSSDDESRSSQPLFTWDEYDTRDKSPYTDWELEEEITVSENIISLLK